MNSNFRLKSVVSDKNLHIHMTGVFDGSSAWELMDTITSRYPGKGDVVIDTERLTGICDFGKNLLDLHLKPASIPSGLIYFKGKYGKELMPEGCRFYDQKGHTCKGNCRNCKCRMLKG